MITKETIFAKANSFTSHSIGEVFPTLSPVRNKNKGHLGQAIEAALGVTLSNQSGPDFPELGIEIKTIPISEEGLPLESTYVCTAKLPFTEYDWESSSVYHKLQCVLFIPIIIKEPFLTSVIATPRYFTLTGPIAETMAQDWRMLSHLLQTGAFSQLSAHLGEYLQIRPKALNASEKVRVIGEDGHSIAVGPKGFYLRTRCTKAILS